MQFNSFVFILLFFPLTAFIYFLANRWNRKGGKIVIIAASCIFYTYINDRVVAVLALSIILNLISSLLMSRFISKKKVVLSIAIIINVGILLYFKYTDFAISNFNYLFSKEYSLKSIVLPLGISFFTFQQIAYCVAVYKEDLQVDVIDYLAYILYFPKLLMGPLMDPVDFIHQFNDSSLKKANVENITNGIKAFSYGLFKKLIIADTFNKAVEWGFSNVDTASSMELILVTLAYSFEIYFDFSGYTDMAVGISEILNIRLPINFDSPYRALSIRDFWKRWHISLTEFFTQKIYIPLGGNRNGIVKACVYTMIVFFISGIWHGANWTFILWGVLHGLLSIFDRLFEKLEKKTFEPVRWIMTFFSVSMLWLLFKAESVGQWIYILKRIFALTETQIGWGLIDLFNPPEAAFICNHSFIINELATKIRGFWLLAFYIGAFVVCLIPNNNYKRLRDNSLIEMSFAAVLFVIAFLNLGTESTFVYFGF